MSDLAQAGAPAPAATDSGSGDAMDTLASFFKRGMEQPQQASEPSARQESAPVPVQDAPEQTEPAETETAEAETEPEATSYDPPAGLSAEQQAAFKSLPPEIQAKILEFDGTRNAETAKKQAEYDTKLRATEKTQAELTELRTAHLQALQRWVNYGQRLRPPSAQLAQENPAQYVAELARYNEEVSKVQAARAELGNVQRQQQAEAEAQFNKYVAEEGEKLRALIPDIAHETKGPKIAADIKAYALKEGINNDQLARASAKELHVLYKSMLYERAQDVAAKAALKAKAEPPKAAKPGNIQANLAAKSNRLTELNGRVAKSGRVEDLAELFKVTDF